MELEQVQRDSLIEAEDEAMIALRFEEAPTPKQQIQQDAVQSIIRQCLQARDEHQKQRYHYQVLTDGSNAKECLWVATELIGFFVATFDQILEECKRLT